MNLELEAAENILGHSLKELAKKDGPFYTIGKITAADGRCSFDNDVYNIITTFTAELIDNEKNAKTFDIEIVGESPLENGIRITFQCPGKEAVVKRFTWPDFFE